ncbi:MAG TPA: GatB/YqeY domain-containing protein [Nitrospirae bacterium]|nr:glutamyl-tRNA(Gln) amidotransferase subunit E [bacterium BMS3Abin08]HDY71735.1 GatB/YqeY domain-containing protein [Nitrospirota bacterium]
MTLRERIEIDFKAAFKSSDKARLSSLRLIKAAFKNREIEKREELSDDEVIEVLSTLAKQQKESIVEFRKGGRTDLVLKEEAELGVIKEYLPEELPEEEIDRMINECISEVSASSISDMGRIMKVLMPRIKGRADGKVVNAKVRKILQDKERS